MFRKPTLLLALGGNALVRKGQQGTISEQFDNLGLPMRQIANLQKDYNLVITHGNGPQVGELLNRQECCSEAEPLPLEILVAQTQGQLGYMLESSLDTALMDISPDNGVPLVSLISYVVVDANDPAFSEPTKPIGPILSEEQALKAPYPVMETEKGYRRVVASPKPITIVEKREIRKLIKEGFIVICCGGGGIPVIREGRRFSGVDAVIDKDLASSCLAREIGVDQFIIVTDVDGAYHDFGTPDAKRIACMTCKEAEELLEQQVFGTGSMAPKIQACVEFVSNGGREAIITSISSIDPAVNGIAGTRIVA